MLNYNTEYMYNSTVDATIAGFLAIYLIILAVGFIFFVISYVFRGIGLFTIAKRQGKDYPWLAFIPFARTYLHGELAGPIKLKRKSIKNPGIWLLALPLISGAAMFVFYIMIWIVGIGSLTSSIYEFDHYGYSPSGMGGGILMGMIVIIILVVIISIIYQSIITVLGVLVNHQIFGMFTSKNMSIAHAVLCTVIPLYESICLFVMRNKDFNPGMEPDMGRPFVQIPQTPVMPRSGGYGAYSATGVQTPMGAEQQRTEGYANVPPVSTVTEGGAADGVTRVPPTQAAESADGVPPVNSETVPSPGHDSEKDN